MGVKTLYNSPNRHLRMCLYVTFAKIPAPSYCNHQPTFGIQYYSCGLSTVHLCVVMSVCHIVVYENSSDDVRHWALSYQGHGHCVTLKFSPFTTIQTVKSYISALAHARS